MNNDQNKEQNKQIKESAKCQGFSGDCCDVCGNFTLKRAGTCLTCFTCGNTTGCS